MRSEDDFIINKENTKYVNVPKKETKVDEQSNQRCLQQDLTDEQVERLQKAIRCLYSYGKD